MSAPKPLLEETETSAFERRMLTAAQSRRAPEGARERGWAALDAAVAAGATRPGKPRAETAAGAKIAAVVSTVGVAAMLVAGGAALLATKAPIAVAPPAPVAIASPSVKVDEPAPVPTSSSAHEAVQILPPAPTPRAHATSKARAPVLTGASTSPAGGSLREEAALLREARSALVRGDLAIVRAKLDEAATRYPTGQLVQERDALEVRLAAAKGDDEAASTLARGFIDRYPDSPLRAGIEPFVRPESKR